MTAVMAEEERVTKLQEIEHRVDRFVEATREQIPELLESLPMYHHVMKRVKEGEVHVTSLQALDGYIKALRDQIKRYDRLYAQLQEQPDSIDAFEFAWEIDAVDFFSVELFLHRIVKSSPAWMSDFGRAMRYFETWTAEVVKLTADMVSYKPNGTRWAGLIETRNDKDDVLGMIDTCLSILGETKVELLQQIDSYCCKPEHGTV